MNTVAEGLPSQGRVTRMLAEAQGLGINVAEMAPPLFRVHVGKHDTGIQPRVHLEAPGAPPLKVWEGSVWFSSAYEFNDREKVLGLQPECEFALPALASFFAAVERRINEVKEERAAARMLQEVEAEHNRGRTVEYYRTLLGGEG